MSHTICENIKQIKDEIGNTQLVVVSKYRNLEELQIVYDYGHRHFGENRVQELVDKYESLPKDIKWHVIGHLQTNKVKYIAPFVHLIHSVDSLKLLKNINKEAKKNNRIIEFLFQLHVAQEDTKFGLKPSDLLPILNSGEYHEMNNVKCRGIMGMATNTEEVKIVEREFNELHTIYSSQKDQNEWDILSMGMSNDYQTAVKSNSTMIRVGSKIFN